MARRTLLALRPSLRRAARALAGLRPEDREDLLRMLELGALIREAEYALLEEIDREIKDDTDAPRADDPDPA